MAPPEPPAVPDDEEGEVSEAPAATSSDEAVAQFIHARWFRPAGVHALEDLDDLATVRRVADEVGKTQGDTLALVTALAA